MDKVLNSLLATYLAIGGFFAPHTPPAAPPQTLNIPKIGVHATVEPVGLDAKGAMAVPLRSSDVSWYDNGPAPGEAGNVAISGHLDTETGKPAVFWNLEKLEVGDTIEVVDVQGSKYTYIVTDKKTYDVDNFPLEEVFGPTDKKRLNLITCQGEYNEQRKSYSQRVVVYSELK